MINRTVLKAACAAVALSALAIAPAHAGLVLGFEGTGLHDNAVLGNAFLPPDTMGAIGTTQFMESTNGSYTVYDRTGAIILRQSMNDFWGAGHGMGLGPTPVLDPGDDDAPHDGPIDSLGSAGDQRILFDPYTNRWISLGFASSVNRLNIGVSDTSDATGSWKGVVLTVLPSGTADYPTLGMDDKGVYIGTNNFSSGGSFLGTSLISIPKSDLFGGAPTVANRTVFTTPYPTVDNGYAIQGAVNWGGNPTNTANIQAVSLFNFGLVDYKVSGVNGPGATVTPATTILQNYFFNNPGRQPDGTRLVDTLDDRVGSNVYQVGNYLYSVHTVTPTGTDFTVVRWQVVDARTNTLVQEGDIGQAGCDFYEGSIAVSSAGAGLIGYNRSCGPGVLPNNDGRIAFLGQMLGADTGTTGLLTLLGNQMLFRLSDNDNYHCGAENPVSTTCRNRWGDYSAVTVDPLDPTVFWAIGEYSNGYVDLAPLAPGVVRGNWHTYIAEVSVPEPSTLALIGLALLSLVGFGTMRRRADA